MSKIKFKAAIACLVIFSILFSTNLPIITLAQTGSDPVVELPGTVSPDLGAPASPPPGTNAPTPQDPAEAVIVLTPRNESAFKALSEAVQDPASPRYRQPVTDTEYRLNYAPDAKAIGDIKSYFAGQGLSLDYESPSGLVLSFKGTLAQRDKAFSTSSEFRGNAAGETGLINVAPLKLPVSLAKNIKGVLGFDQLHLAQSHAVGVKPGSSSNGPTINSISQNSPASLRTAYNIPSNLNGTGANVGIVLWTAPDLTNTNRWKSDNGITGSVTLIAVDPASNMTPNSGDLEAHMDIQLVLSAATNASVRYYVAKNNFFDSLGVALQRAVDDNVNALSSSWGACETAIDSSTRQAYNTIFQNAAAKGIPVFFSSGDSGAFECNSAGSTSVVGYSQFPASDPQVTSVGGTSLDHNGNNTWNNETAWSCTVGNDSSCLQSNGGASTGGATVNYTRPSYQSSITPPTEGKFTNPATNTRLQPDISTNGDPSSGEPIYTNGCTPGGANNCYLGGGTSASAPFMAGIAALAVQKKGGVVGGFNSFVYNNFPAGWGFDVISGYNGVTAKVGWDYTTGKGSIKDVTAFLNAFVSNPVPAISSLSSTNVFKGSAGFTLTINGSNFVYNSVVRWNGSDRTTTYISSTQLQAQVLASDLTTAGTYQVTVFNPAPGGGTSNSLSFTVNNPVPAINVGGLTTPAGTFAGNDNFILTVNGTNFISSSTVLWNGSVRPTTFVNSGQLTAQINAADVSQSGSFPVTVQNPAPGGGTSGSQSLTLVNRAPTITDTVPGAVAKDTAFTLTIDGTYFVTNTTVSWDGSQRGMTYINNHQITINVTAGDTSTAGNKTITVTNPGPGGGSTTTTFTVSANCADQPLVVTQTGDGTTCGYLRYALDQADLANPKGTVTLALTSGQSISLANQSNQPLTIPVGVKVNGVCTPTGPGITINGSATANSLVLGGGNILTGLKFMGFGSGSFPQLKTIASSSGANKLTCSKISKI